MKKATSTADSTTFGTEYPGWLELSEVFAMGYCCPDDLNGGGRPRIGSIRGVVNDFEYRMKFKIYDLLVCKAADMPSKSGPLYGKWIEEHSQNRANILDQADKLVQGTLIKTRYDYRQNREEIFVSTEAVAGMVRDGKLVFSQLAVSEARAMEETRRAQADESKSSTKKPRGRAR